MTHAVTGFRLLDDEPAGQTAFAYDKAKPDPNALSVLQLERWLDEIRNQPQWRREADKCCDYYDNNQLSAEALDLREQLGLGELTTNLIAPTVNAVLGMEAKTRTDWQVGADDDKYGDVAEALSAKMHEVERETQADRATSDAYAALIKAGFGAVEVSRESNPFRYPYRVAYIHRSELFWDWHCRRPDWSDARYVVRKKQFDADHIAAFFPRHKEVIQSAGHWPDWAHRLTFDARMSADLMHSIDQGLRTSWDDLEWRDTTRNRVTCFEVWYRVWVRGLVLKLPGGRVIEFNARNPYHRAVVAAGAVQPQISVFDRIRCAFYIGPIRVQDIATNKRRFPYIPFFGYREDLTGVPYGLIRSMLSPQDEINARAAKMMWLLNARRVKVDSDAVDPQYNTISDVSRELGQADAFVVMNQNRVNKNGGIQVDENMQLSDQQFRIMQERKQAIQEAAGVYAALMGQQSNASSGLAIQSLVEQGVTTLAEINDNYRLARRGVGEALLELIKEDMIHQTEVLVDNGTAKRRIIVNIPRQNPETGQQYKENDVQTAPVKVALSDVPSTATYRQQQFGQFAEILKSMPPEYQALLVPFALEMSDFSRRKEMAEFLRKQLGIVADPNSPEAQQAEQATQQAQAQAAQLEQAKAQAEIAERQARARKLEAEAAKTAQPDQSAQPAAPQDNSAIEIEKARIQQETELEKERIRQDGENKRAAMAASGDGRLEQLAGDVQQLIEEISQT